MRLEDLFDPALRPDGRPYDGDWNDRVWHGTVSQVPDISVSPIPLGAMAGVEAEFARLAAFDVPPDRSIDTGRLEATIDWGDGTTTAGWVVGLADSDEYQVHGFHTYAGSGQYQVGVDVRYGESVVGSTTTTAEVVAFRPTDDTYYASHDRTVATGTALYGPGVLANDRASGLAVTGTSGPTHGALAFDTATGNFTYTPAAGFVGEDKFTYTASYNGTTSTGTVTVVVTNEAPVALDDAYFVAPAAGGPPTSRYTTADGQFTGSLLDNDLDAEDRLAVAAHTLPAFGDVVVAADGTFEYLPGPAFAGADSFQYTVTDGVAESTATAYIGTDDGTYLPDPGVLLKAPPPPPAPVEPNLDDVVKSVWGDIKNEFGFYRRRLENALKDARNQKITLLSFDENNAIWVTPGGRLTGMTLLGDPGTAEKPTAFGKVLYDNGKYTGFYYTPEKNKEGKLLRYQQLELTNNGVFGKYVDASGAVITFDKRPTQVEWTDSDGTLYTVRKDGISIYMKDRRPIDPATYFAELSKQNGGKVGFKLEGGAGAEIGTRGFSLRTAAGYEFKGDWILSRDFKQLTVNALSADMPIGETGRLEVGFVRDGDITGRRNSLRFSYTDKTLPDRSIEFKYAPPSGETPQKLVETIKYRWQGERRANRPVNNGDLGIGFELNGNRATLSLTFGTTFWRQFGAGTSGPELGAWIAGATVVGRHPEPRPARDARPRHHMRTTSIARRARPMGPMKGLAVVWVLAAAGAGQSADPAFGSPEDDAEVDRAVAAFYSGDHATAERLWAARADRFRGVAGRERPFIGACGMLGTLLMVQSRDLEAVRPLREGYQVACDGTDPKAKHETGKVLGQALSGAGQHKEAERLIAAWWAYQQSDLGATAHQRSFLLALLSRLYFDAGRPADAVRCQAEAIRADAAAGLAPGGHHYRGVAALARYRTAAGQLEAAARDLDEAWREAPGDRDMLAVDRGWWCMAAGKPADAVRWFELARTKIGDRPVGGMQVVSAMAAEGLGIAKCATGDVAGGLPLVRQALDVYEVRLGRDNNLLIRPVECLIRHAPAGERPAYEARLAELERARERNRPAGLKAAFPGLVGE